MPRRYRRLAVPLLVLGVALWAYRADPTAIQAGAWVPISPEDLRSIAGVVMWLTAAWLGTRVFEAAATAGGRIVPRVLIDLVGVMLFVGAVIAVQAWVFGQSLTGLLATSGVAVAVLGFALRDVIGDVFSGIALNVEHPYKLDDWLELEPGGPVGRVIEVNWRATRLITLDETILTIPNTRLATQPFQNFSAPGRRFRVTLPVVIDYGVAAERAHQVLTVAVRGARSVLHDPAPDVIADAWTGHGIRHLVRFWVSDYARLMPCRNEVTLSLHQHLRLAGIVPAHARTDLTIARTPSTGTGVAPLLRQIALLRCLDDEDLSTLADTLTPRPVSAGTVIVEAGEPGSSLFFIVEGLAAVTCGETHLATLGAGDVFGEMSLLTGAPRAARVTAATDGSLLEITFDQLRPVLVARPCLVEALSAVAMRRQTMNALEPMPEADAEASEHGLIDRIRSFFHLGLA